MLDLCKIKLINVTLTYSLDIVKKILIICNFSFNLRMCILGKLSLLFAVIKKLDTEFGHTFTLFNKS